MLIVIENLLTTSADRKLYEQLWNLASNKGSKNSKFPNENFSIAEICTQLMREIQQKDPDRNRFYFSTQLAFGTVLLYRRQVEKFYHQVKVALNTCTTTFYDINWLAQLPAEESESDQQEKQNKSKNKKTDPKKRKPAAKKDQSKTKIGDIDLLEEFFEIPDVKETNKNRKRKSNGVQIEDADPTMALCSKQITIIDNGPMSTPMVTQEHFPIQDEFGDIQMDFGFSFQLPNNQTPLNEVEQARTSMDGTPEVLREVNSTPVVTFCDDILDIVNKQKIQRKRRRSKDVSSRLAISLKKIVAELPEDETHNTEAKTHNSPFESIANENELVPDIVPSSPLRVEVFNSTFVEASQKARIDFELQSPVSPVQKPKKKKRKLDVDKSIEISADVIKHNIYNNTRDNLTLQSPMQYFSKKQFQLKCSLDANFTIPGSSLKHASKVLMFAFERNCKKTSANPVKSKKRAREEGAKDEESPLKKRALRKNPRNLHVLSDIDLPLDVPTLEEIAEVPLPEYQQEAPMGVELEAIPMETEEDNVQNVTKQIEYKADYHWSKKKIMKQLTFFWNKKDKSITMPKLCKKMNRFERAGVFFELMVLSKIGSIELEQDEHLQVSNISKGKHAGSLA